MIRFYGTYGPSCRDEETLGRMVQNGMTGIRINLSHIQLKDMEADFSVIREAFSHVGKTPEILMDLQGPEMRIGAMDPHFIKAGEEFSVPLSEEIFKELKKGDRVSLNDGMLHAVVLEAGNMTRLSAKCDGEISGGKSIAIEGRETFLPVLTKADRENIRMAKQFGVTGLMQPFVRGAKDIEVVKDYLQKAGGADLKVFAKIENRMGYDHRAEIIALADEVIVARGDLGNNLPLWEVPTMQKQIAADCRKEKKPFMVVTQMLSSMESRPVPTRAEVSDIYNAVLDGASSLMVTGETAVGAYPAEVIYYLTRTAAEAEKAQKAQEKQ